MRFRNRKGAARKLASAIREDEELADKIGNAAMVSLLRGGIVLGDVIANELDVLHLPLAVAKIPAPFPHSPELAIGALCFDEVYLNEEILSSLNKKEESVEGQIDKAREKHERYVEEFQLKEAEYASKLQDRLVILTDDGVATGSTAIAAARYIRTLDPSLVVLAVPVSPEEFTDESFDKMVVLHRDPYFSAVSQFYDEFGEVDSEQVREILATTKHKNIKA